MAYNQTTKIISSPISFKDVQTCLATSTNTLSGLCKHSGIKKWSKRKPVPLEAIATSSIPLWWRGTGGLCGLTIPEYSTIAALVAAYEAGAIVWNYNKPSGGNAAPYRLADFNGYYHEATSPLLSWNSPIYGINTIGQTVGVSIGARFIETDSLCLTDIANYANWYFGAVISNGATVYKVGTSAASLINTGFSANVPTDGITPGSYKVYPFITPVPIDQNPTKFVAIEDFTPQTIQIYNSVFSPSLTADWTVRKDAVDYTIHIENRGGGTIISNCNIMLRSSVKDWADATIQGEELQTLANISVPSQSSVDVTGSISANYLSFDDWKLWFIGNNGNLVTSAVLMKEMEL